MKLLIGFLLIAFFSSAAFANITADEENLLNHDGLGYQKAQLGTLVNKTQGLLIAKYSYAVQGGTTTADISLITKLNDKKSLATLPNKAIITNVWIDTLTQPTSDGLPTTLAIKAVNSGDLLAATNRQTMLVGFLHGPPTPGSSTTFIKLTAKKTIKLTVGGFYALTAGKFNVHIEYVIGD